MKASGVMILLLASWGLIAPFGCVERELFIQTTPPEAEVWLNGRLEGESPIAIPFNYYGCRDVELRCDGYRAQRAHLELSPPWYQYFPLDFIFDLLWPGTLHDRREFSFELDPYLPKDIQDRNGVLERAEKIKLDPFSSSNEEE